MAGLRRRHPVEARRVREVLGRGHLLEEARLDRDAVHELADRRDSWNASWPKMRASPPSLIRSVESRRTSVDFPSRSGRGSRRTRRVDRERDVLERGHPPPREPARAPVAAAELLRQVDDLDGRDVQSGPMALLVLVLRKSSCCCSFENEKGNGERESSREAARGPSVRAGRREGRRPAQRSSRSSATWPPNDTCRRAQRQIIFPAAASRTTRRFRGRRLRPASRTGRA